jgi:hypothetical protein
MFKSVLLRVTAVLIAGFILLVVAIPVFAGVSVSPVSMEGEVSIGKNILSSISVTNTSTNDSVDVTAKVMGFSQNDMGVTIAIENDTSPCSAVSLIKLNPDEFTLKPGETKKVEVSATIPAGATGGKYATIVIGQVPGAGTSMLGQVAVTVILAISGTSQTNAGQITSVNIIRSESDGLLNFTTTVLNQGDIHVRPTGQITIRRQGQELGKVTIEPHLILPGYDRQLISQWSDTNLNAGTYNFQVNLDIGSGNQIVAEGTFSIDKSGKVTNVLGGIGESGKVIVPPINMTKSPSSTKSVDWRLMGEITGGVFIVGILIYLVATRRKK